MSQYGPPGQSPGQPGGSFGQPTQPFGQQPYPPAVPIDPWDGQSYGPTGPVSVPPGGSPAVGAAAQSPLDDPYGQTVAYRPGYPPTGGGPTWGPPAPAPAPPPRKGNRVVIGIIVVLAALVVAGGAVTLHLLRQQDTLGAEPNGPRTPTPGVDASVTAESPATAEPSKNVRFVEVGQCVRNDGTQERPELVVAACAPKTYEVLARIDGATTGKADAQRKCAPVAGYTDWFYHDTALDELDFVLCLKANK